MTRISPHQDSPEAERTSHDDGEGDPRQTGDMSFLQHLEELRRVLFHSAIACVIGAMAGWWFAPAILEHLIARTVGQVVVLSPIEAFNERVKLTLLLGLLIATPVVFTRAWAFVVPGLLKRERGWVLPMALGSMVLFLAGVSAAYFYVVPLIVDVLGQFMTASMVAQIRVSELLGMTYAMALACGIVCQLPLVIMILTAVGLVTPAALIRQWRYALVGSFAVTAAITPGDVVTAQVVMALPMAALYFLSIGLSWLIVKRRRAAEEEEGGE